MKTRHGIVGVKSKAQHSCVSVPPSRGSHARGMAAEQSRKKIKRIEKKRMIGLTRSGHLCQ
ncbi:hypothetical protein E2C01_096257 [Portunus trituberculatus]|uniref:Uncharacterized protein n=1 Tax=Portunus trituberculatus TaxID=210409 RepID=A0A5B7JV56_PORTR|nr:hypothetical protein [Portunus trituberculatus]